MRNVRTYPTRRPQNFRKSFSDRPKGGPQSLAHIRKVDACFDGSVLDIELVSRFQPRRGKGCVGGAPRGDFQRAVGIDHGIFFEVVLKLPVAPAATAEIVVPVSAVGSPGNLKLIRPEQVSRSRERREGKKEVQRMQQPWQQHLGGIVVG